MLETATLETFAPLLGSDFEIDLRGGPPIVLRLVAADPARPACEAGAREPFSIEFVGPSEPLLAQGTYPFSERSLGAFELFIVPIARDERGVRYEAVFG